MKTNTQPPAAGEAAHTPIPWKQTGTQVVGANGYGVASCGFNTGPTRGSKDAAFIVRACNSHAALVALLEAAENAVYWGLKQHAIEIEQGACEAKAKPGYIVSLQVAAKKARAALQSPKL